jgi:flavorubredoxin
VRNDPGRSPWPREIAHGVHWLSYCLDLEYRANVLHNQTGAYLIVGDRKTLLVDTGRPGDWEFINGCIEEVLGDRPIDFLAPTHPEIPHCGNLARLCEKYSDALVIGDTRDYHLFYPEYSSRIREIGKHEPIDLGGALFVFVEPILRDLTNTQWGYESRSQVLFVSDGFACLHHPASAELDGEGVHRPTECALLASELSETPEPYQAARITEVALQWSKYRPAADLLTSMRSLLGRYPTRLIAPAHGNVIDSIDEYLAIVERALEDSLNGAHV